MEVINTQNQSEDLNTGAFVQETPQKKTGFFKVLFILLFVLLLSSALFYFFFYKKDSVLEQETEKQEAAVEQPEGEIFLTLSPLGTNKPNIYKFDVESMELEEFFPDSPYANFMAKFSPDLEKMVFVRLYQEGSFQIMLYSPLLDKYEELTEKSKFFPRNPEFSSDGNKIVYWVFEDESRNVAEDPEDNNIYILDFNGLGEHIANGAFPTFSPNGEKILFLKSDGLYILDLETKHESLALNLNLEHFEEVVGDSKKEGLGLETWLSLRFSYSPDNNLLTITDTLGSYVHFFEILDWDDFDSLFITDLNVTGANWPNFSSSGSFLTLQEGDVENSLSFLAILDLESYTFFESLVLDQFDSNYVWISDWIIR